MWVTLPTERPGSGWSPKPRRNRNPPLWDPYIDYADAIEALETILGLSLDRTHCYPYGR